MKKGMLQLLIICSFCLFGCEKKANDTLDISKSLASIQSSVALIGQYTLTMQEEGNPNNQVIEEIGYDVNFTLDSFYSFEYGLDDDSEIVVKALIKDEEIVTPTINLANEIVYSKNIFNPYTGEDYLLSDIQNPFISLEKQEITIKNQQTLILNNQKASQVIKVLTGRSFSSDYFEMIVENNIIKQINFDTLQMKEEQEDMNVLYQYHFEFTLHSHGLNQRGFEIEVCEKTAKHDQLKQAFEQLKNGNFTVDCQKYINDVLFESTYYFTKEASYNDDVDNPHGSIVQDGKVYFYQTYEDENQKVLKRDYDSITYAKEIMDTSFSFDEFAIELFEETAENVFSAKLPTQMGSFFAIDILEQYAANGVYELIVTMEQNQIKKIEYQYSLMVLGGSVIYTFKDINQTNIPQEVNLNNMTVCDPIIIDEKFFGTYKGTFRSLEGTQFAVTLVVSEKSIVLNEIELTRLYAEKIGTRDAIGGYMPDGTEYWFMHIEEKQQLYMNDANFGQAVLNLEV